MHYYQRTFGLMIGFKAAFGRHINGNFPALPIGPSGGAVQDLQSELEVTGLHPIRCVSARGGAPQMETRL